MFRGKGRQQQRRRRSELRLGVQKINYRTQPARPWLSLRPLFKFWQRWGDRITGMAMMLVLSWLIYTLFTSSRFFVYTATIRGNVAVSAYEIYTISEIDSQSIFWLDPLKIVAKIEALPNVKSAQVAITLPAEVAITVVERRPELLWQSGDTIWWVDEEGTLVPPKKDLSAMLRIIDDERQPLQPGHKIDRSIVQGAQTLRLLVPEVSVIRYSRAQGLIAATPEGWPVYLGDGSQIKAKLVVLTELLVDLKARNVQPTFIDMRNPLRPVYQPHNIIRIGEPAPVAPVITTPPPIIP
jgi:cell division septal protein FtsQ